MKSPVSQRDARPLSPLVSIWPCLFLLQMFAAMLTEVNVVIRKDWFSIGLCVFFWFNVLTVHVILLCKKLCILCF